MRIIKLAFASLVLLALLAGCGAVAEPVEASGPATFRLLDMSDPANQEQVEEYQHCIEYWSDGGNFALWNRNATYDLPGGIKLVQRPASWSTVSPEMDTYLEAIYTEPYEIALVNESAGEESILMQGNGLDGGELEQPHIEEVIDGRYFAFDTIGEFPTDSGIYDMQARKAYPTRFPAGRDWMFIGSVKGSLYYISMDGDKVTLWQTDITTLKDGVLHPEIIAAYQTEYAAGLASFFFMDDKTICGSDYEAPILLEITLP
ncbi:MAG: hypothetical protein FWF60_08000 [Oscillospiraceae bacterium]|nr:hypothetical protein [Oscillospiraceae bacterium]